MLILIYLYTKHMNITYCEGSFFHLLYVANYVLLTQKFIINNRKFIYICCTTFRKDLLLWEQCCV
jgi:hypothetical protein